MRFLSRISCPVQQQLPLEYAVLYFAANAFQNLFVLAFYCLAKIVANAASESAALRFSVWPVCGQSFGVIYGYFTIGDLHLSLGTQAHGHFSGLGETMWSVCGKTGWRLVGPQDTVGLVGDTSWAMKLEDCSADLRSFRIFRAGNCS